MSTFIRPGLVPDPTGAPLATAASPARTPASPARTSPSPARTRQTRFASGRVPPLRLALATGFALATAACNLYGIEPPSGALKPGAMAPAADELGQAVLNITAVPEDVQCVRITAAGPGRTVAKEIDADGTGALSQTLTGLPLGTVVFTGEAFPAACTSVGKATIAAWASESVEASVVLGRLANVDLVMARNGRAKVDVTFQDEAACTPLAAACRVAGECCSKRCLDHVCTSADAGAPPRD
jgi:hypothetical protein